MKELKLYNEPISSGTGSRYISKSLKYDNRSLISNHIYRRLFIRRGQHLKWISVLQKISMCTYACRGYTKLKKRSYAMNLFGIVPTERDN